jgi:hypothetical protein
LGDGPALANSGKITEMPPRVAMSLRKLFSGLLDKRSMPSGVSQEQMWPPPRVTYTCAPSAEVATMNALISCWFSELNKIVSHQAIHILCACARDLLVRQRHRSAVGLLLIES